MTALAVLPLLELLRDHADDPDLHELLDPDVPERRWFEILTTDDLQLWLIHWPPGSGTGWHDHGTASGAFTILRGGLVEHAWQGALQLTDLGPGDARAFASGHVHDVRNTGDEPALSLHAYSPRLVTMTRYEFRGDRVRVIGVEQAGRQW